MSRLFFVDKLPPIAKLLLPIKATTITELLHSLLLPLLLQLQLLPLPLVLL